MAERTKTGMSLDEFLSHFDEQPFELINGVVGDLAPANDSTLKIMVLNIASRRCAHTVST